MSKEVKPVVERWEDKLSRLHPTIQKGKWPKSWREEAIAQELLELRADYDALLAERDELAKDAERYRWLCASAWYVGPEPCGDTEAVSWHDHNETSRGVTDAIDASMVAAKGGA